MAQLARVATPFTPGTSPASRPRIPGPMPCMLARGRAGPGLQHRQRTRRAHSSHDLLLSGLSLATRASRKLLCSFCTWLTNTVGSAASGSAVPRQPSRRFRRKSQDLSRIHRPIEAAEKNRQRSQGAEVKAEASKGKHVAEAKAEASSEAKAEQRKSVGASSAGADRPQP